MSLFNRKPAPMQKSRANQPVTDEQLATYRAARAFLQAEWFGAILMVASFTQLYVFILGPYGVSTRTALIIGAVMLALGAWIFWSSRKVYLSLDFPWARRWEVVASVFAATGVVFWGLFLLAAFLVWRGVEILGQG